MVGLLLSIPFIGFQSRMSLINKSPLTHFQFPLLGSFTEVFEPSEYDEAFNSLYWVHADTSIMLGIKWNFQFPLLGSYSKWICISVVMGRLSIPFIGFIWQLCYEGDKLYILSIPFIGFRYFLFSFWVFKVFGMINSEAIMAQAEFALNWWFLCQLMVRLMVKLFVENSTFV